MSAPSPRPAAATAAGVERAFEALFRQYRTPIHNYLYRLLGNGALAEDLVQETFARAWKARAQLPELQNPRAWLYRVATNAARDHVRRERIVTWLPLLGKEADLTEAGPESVTIESERMRQALLQLSPDYRIPLILYTCQDFTVAEIAESLQITTDAVKQRLSRGRQKLREAYV